MTASLYAAKYRRIMDDPGASYWLKRAAVALDNRDPQDALCDAEALLALMQAKWAEVLAEPRPAPNAEGVLFAHMERAIGMALRRPDARRDAAIERLLEREG